MGRRTMVKYESTLSFDSARKYTPGYLLAESNKNCMTVQLVKALVLDGVEYFRQCCWEVHGNYGN